MEQNIPQDNLQKIASWRRFSNQKIWKHIVEKQRIRYEKEKAIVFTPGTDDGKLAKYSERDLAIVRMKEIEDLINFPEREIESLSGTFTSPVDNLDPYDGADNAADEDDF